MPPRRLPTVLGYLAAVMALAAVFSLYFSPDLIVDLAGRLWSCF